MFAEGDVDCADCGAEIWSDADDTMFDSDAGKYLCGECAARREEATEEETED